MYMMRFESLQRTPFHTHGLVHVHIHTYIDNRHAGGCTHIHAYIPTHTYTCTYIIESIFVRMHIRVPVVYTVSVYKYIYSVYVSRKKKRTDGQRDRRRRRRRQTELGVKSSSFLLPSSISCDLSLALSLTFSGMPFPPLFLSSFFCF
jgi:hypothetical protein